MDQRPIGVFDSGLGGLTVVRRLREMLPGEDIVYFGDTGRVPYGTRSPQTIRDYARQDCRLLLRHDVKYIISACGTVSSVAGEILRDLPVPSTGVVEPTACSAAAATMNGRIGVIATAATVNSGSFADSIRSFSPQAEVTAVACPILVSLVESGWIEPDNEATLAVLRRYLQPLREADVDTLILGCTHFPILRPLIAAELGDGVALVDSGRETAEACARFLREHDALNGRTDGGTARFFVSDQPESFRRTAQMFLGYEIDAQRQSAARDD